MKKSNAPDADGKFNSCVNWNFNADDRQLEFDNDNADNANQNFGSAVVLRSLCLLFFTPLEINGR